MNRLNAIGCNMEFEPKQALKSQPKIIFHLHLRTIFVKMQLTR